MTLLVLFNDLMLLMWQQISKRHIHFSSFSAKRNVFVSVYQAANAKCVLAKFNLEKKKKVVNLLWCNTEKKQLHIYLKNVGLSVVQYDQIEGFFLFEMHWIDSLHSSPSSLSSAGRSLRQLSPPSRGPSCTLHPRCAPGALVEMGRGGLSDWDSSTADSFLFFSQQPSLSCFHSLTLLRGREDARLGSRG